MHSNFSYLGKLKFNEKSLLSKVRWEKIHSETGNQQVISFRPPPSPPHTRKQRYEKQHSRMQSNAKNSGREECKQKQKSSHTGKIRKQNTS